MNKLLILVTACASGLTACTTDQLADDPAYSTATTGKADSTWCHTEFHSVEGSDIRVDYQVQSTTTSDAQPWIIRTASPVWVNVQRADLDQAGGAHVWIGDEGYTEPGGYDVAVEYNLFQIGAAAQLDLYRSEDATRFTGQVDGGLKVSEYYEGDDQAESHAHQFAVVIDNTWQTDPISGSHNFVAQDLGTCN